MHEYPFSAVISNSLLNQPTISAEYIINTVYRYFNLDASFFYKKDRHFHISNARHVAIYILRENGFTLNIIGGYCKRHHTTVMVSLKVTADLIDSGDAIAADIMKIRDLINLD